LLDVEDVTCHDVSDVRKNRVVRQGEGALEV